MVSFKQNCIPYIQFIYAYMHTTSVHTNIHACALTYPTTKSFCKHTYTYIYAYILRYVHTYIQYTVNSCMHTSVNTQILKYMPTYI